GKPLSLQASRILDHRRTRVLNCTCDLFGPNQYHPVPPSRPPFFSANSLVWESNSGHGRMMWYHDSSTSNCPLVTPPAFGGVADCAMKGELPGRYAICRDPAGIGYGVHLCLCICGRFSSVVGV